MSFFLISTILIPLLSLFILDYNRFISIPYWTVWSTCYLINDEIDLPFCSAEYIDSHVQWLIKNWRWDLENVAKDSFTPIPEMKAADFSYQKLNEMTKGFTQPVVIRGLFNNTKAHQKWTPEFFAEKYADDVLIILTEGRPEVQYESSAEIKTAAGKGAGYQKVMQPVKMKLKTALKRMMEGEKLYLSNVDTIFRKNNDLLDDLEFGDRVKPWAYKEDYAPYAAQMFLGFGAGEKKNTTGTLMHCASSANIFVQAQGSKYWEFVNPRYSALLYPSLGALTPAAKVRSAPKGVPKQYVTLQAGDGMLNPPWYWHEIRNGEGFNVGVATRENHPPWIARNNMLFQGLLEFRATPYTAKMVIPEDRKALRFLSQIPFLTFALGYLQETIKGPVKSPLFTAGMNPCDEHDQSGKSCASTLLDKAVYGDSIKHIPYVE